MSVNRKCSECGFDIPTTAKYCANCGRLYSVSRIATSSSIGSGPSVNLSIPPSSPVSRLAGVETEGGNKPLRLISDMTGSSAMRQGTYQMNGDFILNTYTGDVWRMDEQKGIFKLVEKEEPLLVQIERSLLYLGIAERIDEAEIKSQQDASQKEMNEQLLANLQSHQNSVSQLLQSISNIMKDMNERQKKIIESIS